MRVLIIKTSPLSEVIAALPVLDYLHRAVPEIQVDWVVEDDYATALEGNPLVADLIRVKSLEWKKKLLAPQTMKGMATFRRTLGEAEYDLVFDLEGTVKSGMISRLCRTKDTIGFQREDLPESGNTLFSMRRIPLRRQDRHIVNRCLRLVSVPFAKDYGDLELAATVVTTPGDSLAAQALLATLADGLVFLFDCGAEWDTKLWSEQGWVELAKRILDRFPDASILLYWTDEVDKEAAIRIARNVEGLRVLDRQTLKELAALVKMVDLVVGGDTETVQLAAALGTPTVSFYRSSDGKKCGPRGEQHVVIQSPIHCTRCARERCDKDTQCRDTIKVDMVVAGVDKLLREPS